ncbi:MAG: FlgD immunoglobulin-like domain containing protein [Candidatus Eisenbacteria bacterium]
MLKLTASISASALALLLSTGWVLAGSAGLTNDRTVLVETEGGTALVTEAVPTLLPAGEPVDGVGAAPFAARGMGEVVWQTNVADAIYTSTAIVGATGRLTAGTWLNEPRRVEVTPLDGAGVPDWTFAGTDFEAAAAADADVIAGVDRVGTGLTLYKWHSGSSAPDWSFPVASVDPAGYRTVAVSDDGSTIALVVTTQPSILARLYYFEAASGTLLGTIDAAAGTFARNVSISATGQYVAFVALADAYVVDTDAGTIRWSGSMGATADPLTLSGDGNTLAYGWSSLTVRHWDGAAYALSFTQTGGGFRVGSLDLSSDDGTLAVGWYRNDYLQNRVQLFDPTSSTPIWTYLYAAGTGTDQDQPQFVELTSDGSYLAVGTWGDAGNSNPEIHIFGRTSSTPIFTVDTPGSIFGIDIREGADGVRVAACAKHVHANTTGRGGDLYSIHLMDPADAPEPTTTARLNMHVEPNPFVPGGSITFSAPVERGVLQVVSPGGRVVRALSVAKGASSVRWDGRNDRGMEVPAGVYWLHFGGDMATGGKLVLVR